MTTINLTLTGLTVSQVLKTLDKHVIIPTYLGTDQNFNLLFKITFNEEQEKIVKKMVKYIHEFQQMEEDFNKIADKSFAELTLHKAGEEFIRKPFKHLVIKSVHKNLIHKEDEGE